MLFSQAWLSDICPIRHTLIRPAYNPIGPNPIYSAGVTEPSQRNAPLFGDETPATSSATLFF